MKDWNSRARDCDYVFEELAERLATTPGVHALGEWGGGLRYSVRLRGVSLIAIVEPELHDSELWLHLSVSATRPARVPTWDELKWCKEIFVGDRKAVTVLPKRAEYVNEAPHVLHLFAALERDPLPDFRVTCSVLGRVAI